MRKVAALCVSERSEYRKLAAVECFDQVRDARTFGFDMPVVAHPPCEEWSRMRAFAKVVPGRRDLAYFCLDAVRRCGGVLEHPAGSVFFKELPKPGCRDRLGFTTVIDQCWFGFKARKRTLLYCVGVDWPVIPLSLTYPIQGVEFMSQANRSVTVNALAVWLVDLARSAYNWGPLTSCGFVPKSEVL